MVFSISIYVICIILGLYILLKLYMELRKALYKRKNNVSISVGFFHPYCNAGGGGERVLWCAIRALQNRYNDIHCVVYTGDNLPGSVIMENAFKNFNIKLPRPVEFIYLKHRNLIEAKNYPYFTLLLQSLASFILGCEAAFKYVPDIYIDTMGFAFTYFIFKYLCSSYVGAYVHYPTISTDMLLSVSENKISVNNRECISRSKFLSSLKIVYYKLFALLYSFLGRQADIIMVNSSWTQNHILKLWKKPEFTFIVYPPCDVSQFETLPLRNSLNRKHFRIISIAQFRPEKNHELQLNAINTFLRILPSVKKCTTLVLIGSCRHDEDYHRVEKLKSLCAELGIENNVEFKINITFDELIQEMKNADVSLHTMWNEHFGIGIVECISAGLIMIAHDSGGPKLDIVTSGKTGFLAADINSYADALKFVWNMDPDELLEMRTSGRKSMTCFSIEEFEKSFLSAVDLFKL